MADHDETQAPGMLPRIDDDDVEGHSAGARRAADPDGVTQRRLDEEDVEGHRGGMTRADGGPDEGGPDDFSRTRVASRRIDEGEDDVEGHYGMLKGPSSRGE